MPVERKTKTVVDVITAVKRQFGDESSVQISDSDIIRWVNDAQTEIAIKNPEVNAGMVQINVVADQTVYPLLTEIPDILVVHSIHFDGQYLENMPFTEAQQRIIRSGDTRTDAVPSFWYEYAGTMNLWPKPSVSKALGLTVFYSKQPTLITTDSAPLTVADSYFKSVCDFCLTQAHELDENFTAANVKAQQFETSLQVQANRTHAQDMYYPTIIDIEDDLYGY